jgi:hypothetical protein
LKPFGFKYGAGWILFIDVVDVVVLFFDFSVNCHFSP